MSSRPLAFVLMSQRSGTSALVHTLNEHPGAAVGIERYKYLWPDWPEQYDPALFEAERFFALDESETNILGSRRWETYYRRKVAGFGPGTLSGDKVQPITRAMVRGILERSPGARFLYPFRSLLPLASSYAVRAANPEDENWDENRGALAGLQVWRRDNQAVLELLDDPELAAHVLPVSYEDFFQGDPVTVSAVLDHVGLGPDEAFEQAVADNAERYSEVQGKQLALTYEEVEQLLPHVRDPAFVRLLDLAPSQPRPPQSVMVDPSEVDRLRRKVAFLTDQLERLRSRRSVRAALGVADQLGRLRPGR